MVKTKTLLLLLVPLLLLSAALSIWLLARPAQGKIANLYVDGVCVRSIDLTAVTEPSSFPLETPWGTNTISLEPGRIRVSEADCPDGVCVETGWVSESAMPIVCLPHRLVIQLEAESALADTAAR